MSRHPGIPASRHPGCRYSRCSLDGYRGFGYSGIMSATASPVLDWNAIRIACVAGAFTMEEAAEKFGIPFGTISSRSSREGWYKRQNGTECDRTALAEKTQSLSENGRKVAEIVANTFADDKRRTKAAMAKIARKTTEHVAELEPVAALGQAKALAALGTAYKSMVPDDQAAGSVVVQLNFMSQGTVPSGDEGVTTEAEVIS